MTPEEIRALYIETLARALEPVTELPCCDECNHDPIVHGYLNPRELVDALAEAGLLPTRMEENGALPVYRGDDETIAYWLAGRRRYLTEWQPIEAEVTDVG